MYLVSKRLRIAYITNHFSFQTVTILKCKKMTFINKVVLVTGAGSGLGEAIASHFAKLSARLSLTDIYPEQLKKVSENCEKLSKTRVLKTVADLSKIEDVRKLVGATVKEYAKIDVIVNCAGIFGRGNILDSNFMEVFDKTMDTNLKSIVHMINAAASTLSESKGCIINISDISAYSTSANCLAYNISKASLNHFTKCVALELAAKGIRVNCISPGPVNTNLLTNSGLDKVQSDAYFNSAEKLSTLKQLPKPKEVAEMVAFLASDKAVSITGSTYVVDSGISLLGLSNLTKELA